MWKFVDGNIATPAGFRAAATSAGIKKASGSLDLALIVSDVPGTRGAAVFTTNRVAAAPVVFSRKNLAASRGRLRAVVVNSGNANACTGRPGERTCRLTAQAAAKVLGISPREVMVCSTGVIGLPLDPALIVNRLPGLKENLSTVADADDVAAAILTTDTVPKSAVLRGWLGTRKKFGNKKTGGKTVHLAGVAKGSGMIHPRMATMLAYITTDLAIEKGALQAMLREAVNETFNRITVDGDTSTNDTVAMLANGAAGAPAVRRGTPDYKKVMAGLKELCRVLARKIVEDGEGATRIVEVEVRGARNAADAELAGRAVAGSALVKTALAGADPNWGRILCAVGYSGARVDAAKAEIRVGGMTLCRRGQPVKFDEAEGSRRRNQKEVHLLVDLHQGKASARFWTCDLTEDYIKINSLYRT